MAVPAVQSDKPPDRVPTTPAPSNSESPSNLKSEHPQDFQGDIAVNDDLPSEDDLKKCEELLVLDARGESRPFKSLYSSEGVAPRQLIIFVRHFFCSSCQSFVRALCASITPDDLLSLPIPTFITIIGCGRPELIEMYTRETSCPFPIYADPTRKLYDYLGMTSTWNLAKKKPNYIQSNMLNLVANSVVQLVSSGSSAAKGGNMKQVGGEFLFENSKPVWCHRMRNTMDHTEVAEVRRVIGLEAEEKPGKKKRWSGGIKDLASRTASWDKRNGKNGAAVDEKETKGPA